MTNTSDIAKEFGRMGGKASFKATLEKKGIEHFRERTKYMNEVRRAKFEARKKEND